MQADVSPEFGELETYRDFSILGRITDLYRDTRWRVELRIGQIEDGNFVDKVLAIDREIFKSAGAINLAQAALVEARAAIDNFLDR